MKITVIGADSMGSAIVGLLAGANHLVRVTCRDSSRAELLAWRHSSVQAVTAEGAAHGADVVIVASRDVDAVGALLPVGDISGMVVVDATNPETDDCYAALGECRTSSAEQIAMAFSGADVVKAFNTLSPSVLNDGPDLGNGQRVNVLLASDSERAKDTVRQLAKSMGFTTIDAGALVNARRLESLAALNLCLGYGAGVGSRMTPVWVRRP